MIRKTMLHPNWMPAIVLLLGALAAVLLLWTDRIHGKQRTNYLILDAIMDVQIHTSTFHLWFEQVLAGDKAIDMKEAWEDYDRAIRLVDALLKGGESEHGMIPQPLHDPGMRKQAEEIKTLLSSLKTMGIIRMREPLKAGIGSDLDHLFDNLFEKILVRAAGLELEVQAEQNRHNRRTASLFAGIVSVWTFIVISAAWGLLYREKRRKASEDALLLANQKLLSQAEELKGHREHLTELVDARTKELTSTNAKLTLEIAERMQTETALKDSQTQLRYLSSRLLSAQEEERKKVSRELHDDLGQSLTLIKFQLRSVEKQLREDQGALRGECESTLKYINTVIENVRRLSRDLCPLILEDVGLTRSLKLLADDFTKSYGIRLTLNIRDVDSLLSKEAQTSIYRVVQEALTNIVKHSGAGSARLAIGSGRGSVTVIIEDDGKGFEKTEVNARGATLRGLGLVSMEERVSMLGGGLSVWSKKGKGTHIAFNIPAGSTQTPESELQSINNIR